MVHVLGGNANINQILGNLTLGQLAQLSQTNPAAAKSLIDTFGGLAGSPLQQILGGAIPGAGCVHSPGQALPINQPISGAGYRQTVDIAQGIPNTWWSRTFGERSQAAQIERTIRRNPAARAQFEQAIGGRIVDFGDKKDGVFTVERFPQAAAPIPGHAHNPAANNVLSLFGGMESAVMAQAAQVAAMQGGGNFMGGAGALLGGGALLGAGAGALSGLIPGLMMGNPFMGLVAGGLSGVLMGGMGALSGGMGVMGGVGQAMTGMGSGWMPGFGHLGGVGMGSWNPMAMPGRTNNTNPIYEKMHQAQVASVLHDPSLSVEDKVTLMIMLIMNKMDKDIERQAQYINAIQQQQSNRGQMGGMLGMVGGVAGTVFGGPVGGMLGGQLGGMLGGGMGNDSGPSIDVETMKLKRMIDKRSQMFDMLRQIIDKYNETAKGIIQSIGR